MGWSLGSTGMEPAQGKGWEERRASYSRKVLKRSRGGIGALRTGLRESSGVEQMGWRLGIVNLG